MKEPKTVMALLRKMLGSSQEQMATYLFVSRSLLANAEVGKKSLPMKPSMKLLPLYDLIRHPTPAPEPPVEESRFTNYKTDDYLFRMRIRLINQRKTVQALTEDRDGALAALRHIARLRESTPPPDKGLTLFLNALKASAGVRLGKHVDERLALATLRLQALEAACQAINAPEIIKTP